MRHNELFPPTEDDWESTNDLRMLRRILQESEPEETTRRSTLTLIFTGILFFAIGYTTHYALNASQTPAPTQIAENTTQPEFTAPAETSATLPEPSDNAATKAAVEEPSSDQPAAPVEEETSATPPQPSSNDGATAVAAVTGPPASMATRALDGGLWAARHVFISVPGPELSPEWTDFLAEAKPGGVILREENLQGLSQTERLTSDIKAAVGLGRERSDLPLIAVSQEGGAMNLLEVEYAPTAAALGQEGDTVYAANIGRYYGEAARARGIGIVLAPVLDVYVPGTAYKDMTARSFGQDQGRVASMGLALAAGLRDGGVVPVVKHFPGYGATTRPRGDGPPVIDEDLGALAQLMYPFNEAVAREVPGIVVGHIAVPKLDEQAPSRPASLSPVLVQAILRDRWQYDGVILADDVTRPELAMDYDVPEAVVAALAAGCDAVLVFDADIETLRAAYRAVEDAVAGGTISRDALRDSKRRLDRWRELLRVPGSFPVSPLPPPPFQVAKAQPTESSPLSNVLELGTEEPVIGFDVDKQPEDGDKTAAADDESESNAIPEEPLADKTGATSTFEEEQAETSIPEKEPDSETESSAETQDAAPLPESSQPEAATPQTDEHETVAADDDVDEPSTASPADPEVAGAESPETGQESPGADRQQVATNTPAQSEPAAQDPLAKSRRVVSRSRPFETTIAKYVVRPGDSLASIAERFEVSEADIRNWNSLQSSILRLGDELVIHETVETKPEPETQESTDPDAPQPIAPGAESGLGDDPQQVARSDSKPDSQNEIEELVHKVQWGETLTSIAGQYGVALRDLVVWNSLRDSRLIEGQELKVRLTPAEKELLDKPGLAHVVQSGETLTNIAEQYGTTPESLLSLNNLTDPNHIRVGQRLRVTHTAPE